MRETDGFCIAHCYLPAGEAFFFPDIIQKDTEELSLESYSLKEFTGNGSEAAKRYIRKNQLDEEGSGEHLALKEIDYQII